MVYWADWSYSNTHDLSDVNGRGLNWSTKLIKVKVASEKENKDKLRRNLWEVAACELSKAGHRTLVATMGKKATILNGELELELS